MLPLGPVGRAAADFVSNPQRRRTPGGATGDARGVVSFVALPFVLFWIMVQTWQKEFGTLADWAIFLAATAVLWWAAYRTHGRLGVVAGAGFTLLAAYALVDGVLADGGLLLQIAGGIFTFVVVGGDQVAVKKRHASGVRARQSGRAPGPRA